MASKTLIGGTAYKVSGGKTRVNGTNYAIKHGKTLIGGTAYKVGLEGFVIVYAWAAGATPESVDTLPSGYEKCNILRVDGVDYEVTCNITETNGAISSVTYYPLTGENPHVTITKVPFVGTYSMIVSTDDGERETVQLGYYD